MGSGKSLYRGRDIAIDGAKDLQAVLRCDVPLLDQRKKLHSPLLRRAAGTREVNISSICASTEVRSNKWPKSSSCCMRHHRCPNPAF
jgi:hypothetical protein